VAIPGVDRSVWEDHVLRMSEREGIVGSRLHRSAETFNFLCGEGMKYGFELRSMWKPLTRIRNKLLGSYLHENDDSGAGNPPWEILQVV
jgi:hypothetical protein